jgi:hypothetical protein
MTQITGQQVAKTGAGMVGGHFGTKLGASAGLGLAVAAATGPIGAAALLVGGAIAGRMAGRKAARSVVDQLVA